MIARDVTVALAPTGQIALPAPGGTDDEEAGEPADSSR